MKEKIKKLRRELNELSNPFHQFVVLMFLWLIGWVFVLGLLVGFIAITHG